MRQRLPETKTELETCEAIESAADFEDLLNRLRDLASRVDPAVASKRTRSLDPDRQAQAFLLLAGLGKPPDEHLVANALASRGPRLLTAAAFVVAATCGAETRLQRALLLGENFSKSSPIGEDGRYHLIRFLGFSGDVRFVEVLREALEEHGHYCSPSSVAEALELLGYTIPDDIPWHRSSITALEVNGEVWITEDDKYRGGMSNCRHCRFFPCSINYYYPGAIQDCKLWNKADPEKIGPIRDRRSH